MKLRQIKRTTAKRISKVANNRLKWFVRCGSRVVSIQLDGYKMYHRSMWNGSTFAPGKTVLSQIVGKD